LHKIRELVLASQKSAKRKKAEFLYVIGTGHRSVKVGRSVEPERRKNDLQGGAFAHLRVVYSRACDTAHLAEKIAHTILAQYRQSGEWFQVSEQEAIRAVDTACGIATGEISPPAVPFGVSRKPCAKPMPTPAKALQDSARAAVLEFLRHMDDEVGATVLAFSVWRSAYDDLRPATGWPPLSDKVLSLAMQQCGCIRHTIDDRRKGRGRHRAYELRGTP